MCIMAKSTLTLVAAIDFGTCNTKMAFAFRPSTEDGSINIIVVNDWERAPGRDTMAPTTIHMDPRGEVKAYGFHAEESFFHLSRDEARRSFLFKHFSMELRQKEVRLATLSFLVDVT